MAKQNLLNAMGDVRPSHLLDQNLRQACGMDPITAAADGAEEGGHGSSTSPEFSGNEDLHSLL